MKRALGYSYEEKTFEDGVLKKVVVKEVQPDTTAQIFWLKNRMSANWRDKVEVNNSNNEEINNQLINIANLLNNPRKPRTEEDINE